MKDCIEESTRLVAAVKKFSVGNKFIEHDSAARPLYIRRVRNRFQLQTRQWNYEKAMLIKIAAMFRNLLFSSFDIQYEY